MKFYNRILPYHLLCSDKALNNFVEHFSAIIIPHQHYNVYHCTCFTRLHFFFATSCDFKVSFSFQLSTILRNRKSIDEKFPICDFLKCLTEKLKFYRRDEVALSGDIAYEFIEYAAYFCDQVEKKFFFRSINFAVEPRDYTGLTTG